MKIVDNNTEHDSNKSFLEYCELTVDGTKKEGTQLKGKDVIYFNSPEIYFPENAPLDTENRELYSILNELFQGGSEGGDWQPPEWWIPVPEPKEYEIYILVLADKNRNKFDFSLVDDSTGATGLGTVICDFGDGTTETISPGMYDCPQHTYDVPGQYLIKITGDSSASFVQSSGNYYSVSWQIFKSGSGISFVSNYNESNNYSYSPLFANREWLKYIKINSNKGLPVSKNTRYFSYCYSLQKIELAKKISGNLPDRIFQYCYDLKKLEQFSVDCENITSIGQSAFADCTQLEAVDCPNCVSAAENAFEHCYGIICAKLSSCASVGDYGFSQCYNLQEITVADNCTFGSGCFQNCYSLFPRPNGSVN